MARTGYLYDPERRTLRPSALGTSGGSLLRHDVVVVGAGLAGMRAAIEAKRAGADVAIISKLHPTRSHSGSAEGGINAALGNASEDSPEIHTFDTVKGSDYLGDQDAIEIMCTEAPGDIYELEHMGAVFSRFADGRIAQRPFGAAGSPRTVYSRRHHGPRADPRALRAAAQVRGAGLRGVLRARPRGRRRPLRRRAGLGHRQRRRARHLRAQHDPRHRRRGAHVLRHDERLRLHGRRHVDGLARGRAAQGHGVHAVPPDDAEVERRADHRGLPRRGRVPAQRERRALHGERGAERDGARLARRRLARRDASEIEEGRGVDGCVLLDLTHLGAKKIHTRLPGSRELAMDYAGVDPILEPIPVRPGAHYHMGGVDTDVRRADDPARASTPPASAPASRCTAPTASAATR